MLKLQEKYTITYDRTEAELKQGKIVV